MKSLTRTLLVGLALLSGTSCDTVGDVPELGDLRGRYGGLASGTFRLYDASLDSTFSGTATYGPATNSYPSSVTLLSPDYDDSDPALGVYVGIRSEGLNAPEVGDEFDVWVTYESPEGSSDSVDGRAEVTSLGEDGGVAGVFWARVKDNNTFRIGAPRVIEGGFNAVTAAR